MSEDDVPVTVSPDRGVLWIEDTGGGVTDSKKVVSEELTISLDRGLYQKNVALEAVDTTGPVNKYTRLTFRDTGTLRDLGRMLTKAADDLETDRRLLGDGSGTDAAADLSCPNGCFDLEVTAHHGSDGADDLIDQAVRDDPGPCPNCGADLSRRPGDD